LVASDSEAAMRSVLPQYNNAPTVGWLLTFLTDLGVKADDGTVMWAVETDAESAQRADTTGGKLRRLTAWFEFTRARSVRVEGRELSFAAGERVRLFFSYRYTVEQLTAVLEKYGLRVEGSWATGDEGVVLCRKG